MVEVRQFTPDDSVELGALLDEDPIANVFHLGALRDHGLGYYSEREDRPWGAGVFRGGELTGAFVVMRGTGGIYHRPGDRETLDALANELAARCRQGGMSLLSGHRTQIDPLLELLPSNYAGPLDRCYFCSIRPEDLMLPLPAGRVRPRLAGLDDLERLIDFYIVGFYSLAFLPSRSAWHSRLTEQIANRSMFIVEDALGRVVSAAQSSAEDRSAAMIGGVATLTEHRKKGLSTLCVGALCAHLFNKGIQTVSLFYLKDNRPAERVYSRLGFRDTGEWLLVTLGLEQWAGPFGDRALL